MTKTVSAPLYSVRFFAAKTGFWGMNGTKMGCTLHIDDKLILFFAADS